MTDRPGTASSSLLRDDALEEIRRIGEADLLVGIPSYNNARTIGHVVRAVGFGLAKYFPESRAVLVNSDGGSTDGTQEVVGQANLGTTRTILIAEPARPLQKIITAYQGIPGKGSAFRTVFEIARQLGVRACAVVDSDLRSITPEWVQLLLGPVLHEGFDYVAPLYSRHKFDGTITNAIVYPMVRSLYGKRIRQPIGGDFGFSGRLASHFLGFDVWDTDVARYGIDIWMTTTALTGGFQAIPEFGFEYTVGLEPIPVNIARMVDTFDRGVRDFDGIYQAFLTEITRTDLHQLVGQTAASFTMPPDVWVRLVYEYAAAYHHRRLSTDHLLRSLTPLYLGRTAAWVVEAGPLDAPGVETALDALCGRFEAMKPYLLDRWHEGRRHA
ncbi:MAG: putative Glycosyl transferase, family 2 [Gemmatimonadetes bacterium]|nr:putative Glycosyl transferase, family 2 [Gemmatimonadota bacterium]